MSISAAIQRFYQPRYLVKDELKRGDMPSTREGYSTAFSTAFAAIVETFLIALIGMADTLMVSVLGDNAIAAVGITTQPKFLVQTLVFSLNVAVTSICARRYGERDRDGATSALKQGLVVSSAISVLLFLISVPLARQLVLFMRPDASLVDMAYDYLFIILLGVPLHNLSLTISSALRGIGRTSASMVINMSINIVNVILNWFLISGKGPFPALGVKGAAIATVIGYGVGLLIALAIVFHPDSYLFLGEKGGWRFRKTTLYSFYKVSSGSFVEQVCVRAGFMMYAMVINGLGDTMTAAHQILMNILSLSFSFGEGFGIAASALVGQNLGAKRPDLSIVYGKICQRMSIISSAILFVVFTLWGEYLVRFFTTTPEILAVSEKIFVLMGIILIGQSSQMVFMGALRGAGDTKYTAIISLICILFLRPFVGYVLAYPVGLGLVGAWVGIVFDQLVRLWLTNRRFSSGRWMEIRI